MADKFTLSFVIRGKTFSDDFAPNQPLHASVQNILAKTGNTGREDWTARKDGAALDQSRSLAALGLGHGDTIFLSTGPAEQGAA